MGHQLDGLQPEQGHETLYVVRELTQQRVWCGAALLAAPAAAGQRRLAQAKAWAAALAKPAPG